MLTLSAPRCGNEIKTELLLHGGPRWSRTFPLILSRCTSPWRWQQVWMMGWPHALRLQLLSELLEWTVSKASGLGLERGAVARKQGCCPPLISQ